jgi:oligoribonuclease NrnB/cAMP/cGMP phosphodiesterase (DHH superfamily)
MESVACIYHKDCIDGTTAAAVVLRAFPHAHTIPLGHSATSTLINEALAVIPLHAHIYIVDTVMGLEECLARGHHVTVLDHHVSEHARVSEIAAENDRCTYVYDVDRSGASLAWSYFFKEEPAPPLIAHVEDKDLWLLRTPHKTACVINRLSFLRNDPASIGALIDVPIETLYAEGAILAVSTDYEVNYQVTLNPIPLRIDAWQVPAYNITNHQSTCGNILSEREGKAVALYTVTGSEVRISFRSQKNQSPSALDLALKLGGGGHVQAAGARLPLKDFIASITSN